MSDNQTRQGHYKLYTYPTKKLPRSYNKDRFQKLTLVATNNFEGKIHPTQHNIKNRFNESRVLKIGGITALRAYLDIFEAELGKFLIYLDSGSFLNKVSHQKTLFLYNYLGLDIASLGLNEFQISNKKGLSFQRYLPSLVKKSQFPIITSNIFNLKTTKKLKWKGISEHYIKSINNIKVGFISILTQRSSEKISDQHINGLYIQNASKTIITKTRELRRKGANIIVLLTNGTIDCTSRLAFTEKVSKAKVNFFPKYSKHCQEHKSELYKMLKGIPPKTIDLVFTSGDRSKVTNNILGYPVLQNEGHAQFLSWVDVYFDKKHNAIDTSMTKIHQPVHLCHHFLKDSQDCFTEEGIEDQELVPAKFLGHKINVLPLPTNRNN